MTGKEFKSFSKACQSRVDIPVEARRGNVIAVEIGTPQKRCLNKKPDHWPTNATALRWIGSGGDYFVFGHCSQCDCPRLADQPEDLEA